MEGANDEMRQFSCVSSPLTCGFFFIFDFSKINVESKSFKTSVCNGGVGVLDRQPTKGSTRGR
jgi:hypothetical protein